MRGEMPVETQMVTDGLETNQPGGQDLCSGTSQYVCVNVFVCLCVCVKCMNSRLAFNMYIAYIVYVVYA